jgi:hypothetical protein
MLKIRIIQIKVKFSSIREGAVMPTLEGLRAGSRKKTVNQRVSRKIAASM